MAATRAAMMARCVVLEVAIGRTLKQEKSFAMLWRYLKNE